MNFFKNNWIYIVIAFAVVFLVGIGYITYTRLSQLTVVDPTPQQNEPTKAPASEVELSFKITPSVPDITGLSCIELVATPLEGTTPLTVSFTGLASDTTDNVLFNFNYGDNNTESIPATVSSNNGIVTKSATHTYTRNGDFNATLSVESENGNETSSACTITIQAGNTVTSGSSPTPVVPTQIAFVLTATPFPSSIPQPSPTITTILNPTQIVTTKAPTVTPTTISAATRAPTPTDDVAVPNIPQAGSFFPTFLAFAGGIMIVILAFVLI